MGKNPNTSLRAILVTGGRSVTDSIAKIAYFIGQEVVKNGYVLLTGGATGIDTWAAKGAYDFLNLTQLSIQERIITFRPEESPTPPLYSFGQIIITGRKNYHRQERIVQAAEVIIIVAGNVGTDHIFDCAIQQHKPILPIGRSGGMALEKWKAMSIALDHFYNGKITPLDFQKLNSSIDSNEDLAQWAVILATRLMVGTSSGMDIDALHNLARQYRANLMTIFEQQSSFIDPRGIPPDLKLAEEQTKKKLEMIEMQINEIEESNYRSLGN